jgi:hypothetical protein
MNTSLKACTLLFLANLSLPLFAGPGAPLSPRNELIGLMKCWAAAEQAYMGGNGQSFRAHATTLGNSGMSVAMSQFAGPLYSFSENFEQIRVETGTGKDKQSKTITTDCEVKEALLNLYRDLSFVGTQYKLTEADMPAACRENRILANKFFHTESYMRDSSPAQVRAAHERRKAQQQKEAPAAQQ